MTHSKSYSIVATHVALFVLSTNSGGWEQNKMAASRNDGFMTSLTLS
jgi:hypothetical protein